MDVETPVKLTRRQKEILEEFQAIEAEQEGKNTPASTGFFAKFKDMWSELTD